MREVGSGPQCNTRERRDCSGSDYEQEQEKKDSFTAEKLPYRRVRLAYLHLLLIQPQTVNF
jgi:hypothetical protein